MAKSKNRIILSDIDYDAKPTTITVYDDGPKIKIYDYSNDGTYWFTKIGFNRKINIDD